MFWNSKEHGGKAAEISHCTYILDIDLETNEKKLLCSGNKALSSGPKAIQETGDLLIGVG
jgi:hypothetical protein